MKLDKIIRNALIGIFSLSLYSCGDKELHSSKMEDIVDTMADDSDSLRDNHSIQRMYETNIAITDQFADKSNFILDSSVREGSYNLLDASKSDSSPEVSYRNQSDCEFYADEVDSLPETVVEILACIDKDGDGYGLNCILGSDCDDYNSSVHQILACDYDGNSCGQFQLCGNNCPSPPVLDDCNGIDDDCDGIIDEDFIPYADACFGYGEENLCSKTYTACVSGEIHLSFEEKLFNSCSDIILPCLTYTAEPPCNKLTYQCNLFYLVDPCHPFTIPSYESECDGLDNNCDGIVDGNTLNEPNPLLIQYVTCGEESSGLKEQICTSGEWKDLTSCIFDCIDWDYDSYGPGPNCLGEDCNDDNPSVHDGC
jgi:hypothetical protein